jgi:hypothetical protein
VRAREPIPHPKADEYWLRASTIFSHGAQAE